jgi:uncharacterized membrane protein YdjX (TVP38/TMEM64 family)
MSSDPDTSIEPEQRAAAASSSARAATIGAWTCLVLFLALGGWSWASGGLVYDMLRADHEPTWKLARLKQYFDSCGVLAPVAYFLFVTIEVVVAPIPGLMLYAPGGLIFGGFFGGLIALAGNVVGAGIACQVTRSLGGGWLIRFFSREAFGRVQTALERRGGWLIFLLRLNPLTSSDLVSYAAGFTPIPVWKVMLATLFGMAPLCFAQAYLAENLFQAFPNLLYPLLILCVAYVVAVVLVVRRLASGESSVEHEPASQAQSAASITDSGKPLDS